MRKLTYLLLLAVTAMTLESCFKEDDWDKYKDWREAQQSWMDSQLARTDEQGRPFYEKVVSATDANGVVYMHFFNDRNATASNLSPLYTSTVDVRYHGRLYNDVPFDSSYTSTSPKAGVRRFALSGLISGWNIALQNMHVGDSVQVLIPYESGYGVSGSNSIPPYSALVFLLKLEDIYKYEAK